MKKKIQKQEAILWADYIEYRDMCGEESALTKMRLTSWCAVKDLMKVLGIDSDYSLREYRETVTLNNP